MKLLEVSLKHRCPFESASEGADGTGRASLPQIAQVVRNVKVATLVALRGHLLMLLLLRLQLSSLLLMSNGASPGISIGLSDSHLRSLLHELTILSHLQTEVK